MDLKRLGSLIITAVLGCLAAKASGDDYTKESFSLRFPAAISRFSPYGDVAAVGGASAASKWSSSINPASTGWLDLTGKLRLSPSFQYVPVLFAEGTNLHVTAEALNWQVPGLGTLQPGMAQVCSNRRAGRDGMDFETHMELFQVQWGRRIGDSCAVGANFNFTSAEMIFGLDRADLVESTSESYAWRFGGLYQPAKGWLLGLVLDYGVTPSRTALYDISGQGIGKLEDTANQFSLRPGVSYEYKKDSAVYLDYQLGALCDSTGKLLVHRFYAGVDHQVVQGFAVRCGVGIDTEGRGTWALGLGIYPTDWLTIDLAYQDNAFPELSPDFGRARMITFSVGLNF